MASAVKWVHVDVAVVTHRDRLTGRGMHRYVAGVRIAPHARVDGRKVLDAWTKRSVEVQRRQRTWDPQFSGLGFVCHAFEAMPRTHSHAFVVDGHVTFVFIQSLTIPNKSILF